MSNLEDLVPPLELCRKIPFPKFEDSVFVWDKEGWLSERNNVCCDEDEEANYVPAPTLQEIFGAFVKMETCPEMCVWSCDKNGPCFRITAYFTGDEHGYNAAEAALKLWLNIDNKIKTGEK